MSLTKNLYGYWDRFKLEQVLTNLLTNALKYGNGSDVEIGCSKRGRRICFYVKDNGLGIPEDHLSKIFGLFERVNNEQVIGGLGLGLFIVKEIVEAHEGRISVDSELGKGSTFLVEI